MYKKKFAMDTSSGKVEDLVETDQLAGNAGETTQTDLAVSKDVISENTKAGTPGREGIKRSKRPRSAAIIKTPRKIKTVKKPAVAPPKGSDENDEWEVEAIVDHKKEKGKTLYRIRWKGFGARDDTWHSSGDLNCKELLKKYNKKLQRETKDVYSVLKIVDHRRLHGQLWYKVRWEGYTSTEDSWQLKETLSCPELLKQYHEEYNDAIFKREEAKLKAKAQAKNNNVYEVEAIVDSKIVKGKVKYRVHWKDWDSSDDTWEFEEALRCPDLIRDFKKKNSKSTKKVANKKRKRQHSASEGDSNDSDYDGSHEREYEVTKVLNGRVNREGKWDFFVMWKGYGPEDNNWEPEENLNCPKLIDEYLGKDRVPRSVLAMLEKRNRVDTVASTPKRKSPSERGTLNASGLRGRTKGASKVLRS